ncbi:hypothetical protein D5086_005383 [Populus alba]|uniref:Uncharacterized protein n=1 Tax=Populus alba TaxID=43335 RepID=A0ACC4CT24_POPAL
MASRMENKIVSSKGDRVPQEVSSHKGKEHVTTTDNIQSMVTLTQMNEVNVQQLGDYVVLLPRPGDHVSKGTLEPTLTIVILEEASGWKRKSMSLASDSDVNVVPSLSRTLAPTSPLLILIGPSNQRPHLMGMKDVFPLKVNLCLAKSNL